MSSLIGAVLKTIFGKRSVTTVHTVYDLEKRPMLGKIFTWILNANDCILLCAKRAQEELLLYGLNPAKALSVRHRCGLSVD